jgi:uncharacterized protein (DUF302 family)
MDFIISMIVFGALILLLVIWLIRKNAIQVFYTDAPISDVETRLQESIDKAGWKLIASHDVREKLENAGFPMLAVKVYEICKPDYAAAVLEKDHNKKFSALMPCRVSLFETNEGRTGISVMNAGMLANLFGGVVARVMGKAAAETETIIKYTLKKASS